MSSVKTSQCICVIPSHRVTRYLINLIEMSHFLQFSPASDIKLLSHVASSSSPWANPHITIQPPWLKTLTWCYMMTPSLASKLSCCSYRQQQRTYCKKSAHKLHTHTLAAFLSTRPINCLKSFVFTQHYNRSRTAPGSSRSADSSLGVVMQPAGIRWLRSGCCSSDVPLTICDRVDTKLSIRLLR